LLTLEMNKDYADNTFVFINFYTYFIIFNCASLIYNLSDQFQSVSESYRTFVMNVTNKIGIEIGLKLK
jgi:hypothetical protein